VESSPTLYVNPACSKSRSAVALLEDRGVAVDHVHYLETPLTVADLEQLMGRLGIDDPRQMMRTTEPLYAELEFENADPETLLTGIAQHPILLERPIFDNGERAVVARPPERLLELL
jgi:arsenate reductase